jgi:hypothetical protein
MSGELKTQGTHLYLNDTAAVVKFNCPTGITGLGGAADQIEATCLDATADKSYVRGLGNPGQVSVPFNFKPSQASHQLVLTTLKASGADRQWMIGFSDGTSDPTVDSSDDLDPGASRTCAIFTAYVADVTIDVASNEIVRGTMTLQRSGSVEWTFKT